MRDRVPGLANAFDLICQRFDAERKRSSFLLFDAHQVAAGPVAELGLEHPIHLGFHASFAPAD